MLRLIVNADDFGRDHGVNIAIENEIKKGNITSTSIMANAEGFEEAVRMSSQNPSISYGIHLCLDEYSPITKSDVFVERGLVDENTGQFVKGRIWQTRIDEALKLAIKNEWNAQIKKVIEAGVKVSHIDSHHHVHTIPALEDVLLEVLIEYNITKVRGCDYCTCSKLMHGWRHFNVKNIIKEVLYYIIRFPRFRQSKKWMVTIHNHFKVTDDFCSVTSFLRNVEYFNKYGANMCVELECHPGHDMYKKETRQLTLLKQYQRLSYNEL